MAGSVSIEEGGPPGGGPAGASSVTVGMKSPRSSTVCSASRISGSPRPTTSRRPTRFAGDDRSGVTSTNSLPPATCIGASDVSFHMASPSGFMGSVIICW